MISLNILDHRDRCSQLYSKLWDNLRIPAGALEWLLSSPFATERLGARLPAPADKLDHARNSGDEQ